MHTKVENTYWVKIYLSGPIEVAKQILREYCLAKGFCVTIEPTTFIYTGGEEGGYVVGLLNYPRFPMSSSDLNDAARNLALLLLDKTFQHSALVVDSLGTIWYTKRDQNGA